MPSLSRPHKADAFDASNAELEELIEANDEVVAVIRLRGEAR